MCVGWTPSGVCISVCGMKCVRVCVPGGGMRSNHRTGGHKGKPG